MPKLSTHLILLLAPLLLMSCAKKTDRTVGKTALEILGNPEYLAISYSGYRGLSRDDQPTVPELKEDMKLLSAMGIKLIRTYNVYLEAVPNVLKAIRELKKEDPNFEMFVMLGAWISCKDAYTDAPIHSKSSEKNVSEIKRAVRLTNTYPDIVKIIAVGNEAMVKWQTQYYVEPAIILKWVTYLLDLKKQGKLPALLWITSSDNFASWGGGGNEYHVEALNKLIKAVDFISMHTYPMHDTHYNPDFWGFRYAEKNLSDSVKIMNAMHRARDYAVSQYNSVKKYMKSVGVNKPVHIGETGWASVSNGFYGDDGSRAVDEYKAALYYTLMRGWSKKAGVTVFYFEAFDEQWKDAQNPDGSENHFGLINLKLQAKYAIWDLIDKGVFKGVTRDGKPVTKTFDGNVEVLMKTVKVQPSDTQIQAMKCKD